MSNRRPILLGTILTRRLGRERIRGRRIHGHISGLKAGRSEVTKASGNSATTVGHCAHSDENSGPAFSRRCLGSSNLDRRCIYSAQSLTRRLAYLATTLKTYLAMHCGSTSARKSRNEFTSESARVSTANPYRRYFLARSQEPSDPPSLKPSCFFLIGIRRSWVELGNRKERGVVLPLRHTALSPPQCPQPKPRRTTRLHLRAFLGHPR